MNKKLVNLLPKNVFFITPEISQALGIVELIPETKIITGRVHPLIPHLRKNGREIFCLEEIADRNKLNWKNTASILACEESMRYIKERSDGVQPAVAYFKPSPKLDLICKENNFLQLAGPAPLNRLFENKFLFEEIWNKTVPTVPAIIDYADKIITNNSVQGWLDEFGVVIQHERGWAGQGTIICKNQNELELGLENESGNKVKVSKYIRGNSYTVNFVIGRSKFWIGEIAMQINSPTPDFGSSKSTTCGRKWPSDLSNEVKLRVNNLVTEVCKLMQTKRYRGFAGVDVMVDDDDGSIYLLEVNPRLTASESFQTRLELDNNVTPLSLLHYLSFINQNTELESSIEYGFSSMCGIQLLLRNTNIDKGKICSPLEVGKYIWSDDKLVFIKSGYGKIDDSLMIWSGGKYDIDFNEELIKIETIGNYDLENEKLLDEFIKLKNSIL